MRNDYGDMGMTQVNFADSLSVTRQTVSRWETGAALPDIDKISDIAKILDISCDYLLNDEIIDDEKERATNIPSVVSNLLISVKGKKVILDFCEGEEDIDLINTICTITDFEGNWIKVTAHTKKDDFEKLIPLSSIFSIEIVKEEE